MNGTSLLRPEVLCSPVQWGEQFTWKLSRIVLPKPSYRTSDALSPIMDGPTPLFQIAESVLLELKRSQKGCFPKDGGILKTLQYPTQPSSVGIYECLIKQSKRALRTAIENQVLSWNEIATVFAEVNSLINSGPLGYSSSDPNELQQLQTTFYLVALHVVYLKSHLKSREIPESGLHSSRVLPTSFGDALLGSMSPPSCAVQMVHEGTSGQSRGCRAHC